MVDGSQKFRMAHTHRDILTHKLAHTKQNKKEKFFGFAFDDYKIDKIQKEEETKGFY